MFYKHLSILVDAFLLSSSCLIKTTKKQVQAFGSHLSDGLCVFLVFVLIVV